MYRPIYTTLCALLVCLFTLPSMLTGQTPPDPLLANATTDCGPNNSRVPINWSAPFTGSVESGRRRYGGGNLARSCFGQGPNCTDIVGQCIQTEAERQEAIKILLALAAGTCSPPRGTLFPSEQTLYDWTLASVGARSGMDLLRKKYEGLGCGPVGGTNPFTCPSGQSCKPPCPVCAVCPVCEVCSTCLPVAPAGTPVPMSTIPPENTPLLLWDRLDSERLYRGKRVGDDVYLVGAARLKAEDFSHWMEVPRLVK
jgi:hypothetical protein